MALDVVGEGRRADHQHVVVAGQLFHDALAHRRQVAGELCMAVGEAAAAGHRRMEDTRLVRFRELQRRVPGAVAVDGRADDEGWALGGVQRRGDLGQQRRLGAQRLADASRRHVFARHAPVVGRHRHQHRPTRRHHRQVVGACDGARHVGGTSRLHRPLDIGLRQLGGPRRRQEGVEGQDAPRLLPDGDEQGRAVLVGGEDRAHGVADTHRRMQVDEGGVARGLREAVGHADDHRFLQPEHVAEVGREVEEHRQLGRAGVAEDRRQPQAAQQFEGGFAHGGTLARGRGVVASGQGSSSKRRQ